MRALAWHPARDRRGSGRALVRLRPPRPAGSDARGASRRRRGARRDLVLGGRLRLLPRRRGCQGGRRDWSSAAGRCSRRAFGDFVVPNISPDPADGIGSWIGRRLRQRDAARRGAGRGPPLSGLPLCLLHADAPRGRGRSLGLPADAAGRRRQGSAARSAPSPTTSGAASASGSSPSSPTLRRLPSTLRTPWWRAGSISSRGRAIAASATRHGTSPARSTTTAGLAERPSPEGKGRVPNISPSGDFGDWSPSDIVYFFETGFTPDFDSVGGSMVEVQENLAMLEGG